MLETLIKDQNDHLGDVINNSNTLGFRLNAYAIKYSIKQRNSQELS
jgi:hypothetical protein